MENREEQINLKGVEEATSEWKSGCFLRVAGFEKESVVDGPGVRYTIFVQGCLHNCPGCHNPKTHSLTEGQLINVFDIYEDIKSNPLVRGVTFSGGEPILQYKPLELLASLLKEQNYHLISYTGFTYEELYKNNMLKKFLSSLDWLIDGPFIETCKSLDCKYRGSTNQRIIDIKKSLDNNGTPVFVNI